MLSMAVWSIEIRSPQSLADSGRRRFVRDRINECHVTERQLNVEFKGNPNLEQLSSHLAGESPRCAVIVSAAYFDVTLASMLGDTKDRSFYARIDDSWHGAY